MKPKRWIQRNKQRAGKVHLVIGENSGHDHDNGQHDAEIKIVVGRLFVGGGLCIKNFKLEKLGGVIKSG